MIFLDSIEDYFLPDVLFNYESIQCGKIFINVKIFAWEANKELIKVLNVD